MTAMPIPVIPPDLGNENNILKGIYARMSKGDGVVASASFTPAAAAYGAGDIISVAKEFAFTDYLGEAIPAGSLIRIISTIMKIGVTSVPDGQTSYNGRCYAATPGGTPQADNDLWALAAGDLSSYRGKLALGTPVDEGGALYVKSPYIDTDIKLITSSLWMQLVTDAAFTATAVDREVLLYGVRL